jgi:hypothetical protein
MFSADIVRRPYRTRSHESRVCEGAPRDAVLIRLTGCFSAEGEDDLPLLALAAAARSGDPDPALIQHTTGTRGELTKLTGSWGPSDEPSWMIAIRGRFTLRPALPPSVPPEIRREASEDVSCTGRVTDSGASNDYPDLVSVGPVVTDRCAFY